MVRTKGQLGGEWWLLQNRELEMMKMLRHQNVVRLYSYCYSYARDSKVRQMQADRHRAASVVALVLDQCHLFVCRAGTGDSAAELNHGVHAYHRFKGDQRLCEREAPVAHTACQGAPNHLCGIDKLSDN